MVNGVMWEFQTKSDFSGKVNVVLGYIMFSYNCYNQTMKVLNNKDIKYLLYHLSQ